jgi:hypothetical protein
VLTSLHRIRHCASDSLINLIELWCADSRLQPGQSSRFNLRRELKEVMCVYVTLSASIATHRGSMPLHPGSLWVQRRVIKVRISRVVRCALSADDCVFVICSYLINPLCTSGISNGGCVRAIITELIFRVDLRFLEQILEFLHRPIVATPVASSRPSSRVSHMYSIPVAVQRMMFNSTSSKPGWPSR